MSDQDPFNKTQEQNQETPDNNSPFDSLKNITDQNGRQKYETVDQALKALEESQKYIPTLQDENKELTRQLVELKEKVDSMGSVDDLLNDFKQQQEAQRSQETPTNTGLDENIDDKIVSTYEKMKLKEQKEANQASVTKQLFDKFGDKTVEIVKQKATQLNVSPERLGEMSQENPALVLSLFNEQVNSSVNPTTTSTNSSFGKEEEMKLQRPDKSLMMGARNSEILEHFRKTKEYTNKRLNVEI